MAKTFSYNTKIDEIKVLQKHDEAFIITKTTLKYYDKL